MSMDKEDKLDKELKEELEWLKYHAGSWEKLAYILYSFLPDQMQAFDRVIAVKSLQSEPRGTKLKYPTDDRMKWNIVKRINAHTRQHASNFCNRKKSNCLAQSI